MTWVEFSHKIVMNNNFVKINCATGYSNVHEYRKCVDSKLNPNNETYPFKFNLCIQNMMFSYQNCLKRFIIQK